MISRGFLLVALCGILEGFLLVNAKDAAPETSAPAPSALPRCQITKDELRKGCEEYFPYGFVSNCSAGSIVLSSAVSVTVGLLLGGLLVHCFYKRKYGSVYTGYIEIGS